MSAIRSCRSSFVCVSVLIACLSIFLYYCQPDASFNHDPSLVKVSNDLGKMEKLDVAPYSGCESIVSVNGSLYTGVAEGKILKVDGSRVHVFTQLGKPNCTSYECGRPLGMRLSHDGQSLYVADAYLGLFEVPLSTGVPKRLFPLEKDFEVKFFNDFDVHPDGTIILSESSTKYSLHDLLHVLFEEKPSGRLLSINPTTGQWRVLLDGLRFANGVQLHTDAKSVLVAECGTSRILRVPLNGGATTVFTDNLIGYPDNIRPSPRGGYWVPVVFLRTTVVGKFLDVASRSRWLRWFVLKVSDLRLLQTMRLSKSTILLRLDDQGQLVEAICDPSNSATNVAEVCELGNMLYTGSYYLPFIGRLHAAS